MGPQARGAQVPVRGKEIFQEKATKGDKGQQRAARQKRNNLIFLTNFQYFAFLRAFDLLQRGENQERISRLGIVK